MTEIITPRKRLLEDSFDITPAGLQFCFDRELFLKDEFNVDKFVMRQKKVVSLELLRDYLLQYFNILKNSLVELINQDYADFVNLSTNLVGLDKVISTIESPVEKWKLEIENVRNHFIDTLDEIDKKKLDLKILRSKRELIHSIEGVQRCMVRLEKWLNISNESEPTNPDKSDTSFGLCDIEIGLQEDVGQRLERIGNEFSKLEYFTRKCLQHCLVEKYKPRIIIITSELQSQLEKHLVASFNNGNRKFTQQALRTYLGINKISVAEQLYRDNFVRPLLEKLTSSKSNIDQDLSGLYQDIMSLVDNLLNQLTDILTGDNDGYELLKDFDFLVNSVWPEIAYYFINNQPQLFSPGNPDLFHTRYTFTMTFIDELELRCLTFEQLKKLRASKAYNDFINKWSVAVYFQIRYQDISSLIDKEVTKGGLTLTLADSEYRCTMINVISKSIQRCWADGVYLDSLKHRFWRLNCQLLNFMIQFVEHVDWTNDTVADVHQTTAKENDMLKGCAVINNKAVLLLDLYRFLRTNSMETISMDNKSGLLWIYDELIAKKMGECLGDKERVSIQEVLVVSTNEVIIAMKTICGSIQSVLTEQCMQSIKSVFDIPRQYRRTNRPWPTKASDYVGNIFKPILKFIHDNKEIDNIGPLKTEILRKCILDITVNYQEQIKDLLLSVKKMEDSLKRLKLTRGGGATEQSNLDKNTSTVTDDDKIRRQVIIDIDEFNKKGTQILGVADGSLSELNDFLRLVSEMCNSQDL